MIAQFMSFYKLGITLNMIMIHRDKDKKVYTIEFVWPSEAKHFSCASPKPMQKNRKEDLKFNLGVSKCNRIFDELLCLGHIKISHVIPPLEELKRQAYCIHNSHSHATNNCNVFRRQVQSAVDGPQVLESAVNSCSFS